MPSQAKETESEEHESPQMLVLGASGEEKNEFLQQTSTKSAPGSPKSWKRRSQHQKDCPPEEIQQPSLFSRILGSGKGNDEENSDVNGSQCYAKLSDPNETSRREEPEKSTPGYSEPLRQSLIGSDGLLLDDSPEHTQRLTLTTEEDVLQQDCSFFYRDMDDDTAQRSQRGTPRFSSLLRQSSPAEVPTSMYSCMSSPPILQAYRNRYDQLNQDLSKDEILEYDLELGEDDAMDSSADNGAIGMHSMIPTSTAEHSSLFYVRHGKLLMKLPQDHTRLAMEPDLEPGILSVEQRRLSVNDSSSDGEPDQALEPLQYVLTVPEDLYRRVVADLSSGVFQPHLGMTASHDHKVDIRVAIAVLVLVFFVLWVNVMVWPHQ